MKTPYLTQQQAIDQTLKHLDEGKTKVINIQACGVGKTEISAWITKNIKGNVLFVVHKNTILKQASKTYSELVDKDIGYFTSEIKETHNRYIFANIMTLHKDKNLSQFNPDYFEAIIIDECHHMATPSYDKLLNYFNNKLLFGFTATPYRLDRKPILELFDAKVGTFDQEGNDTSLLKNIELGYLSPLRYFDCSDNIDYNKIYHNGYKYKRKDLDKVLIVDKRNDLVVDKWLEMAKGKKTIGFCNGIKHIESMLKAFESRGIKAIGMSYKTSKSMQKIIEEQFRRGVYDIILTVDLYIEGIDFPSCECVMFLRPTESERIFVQQIGRVTRIFEGKRYGLIMDFVGNQKNARDRKPWIEGLLGGKKLGNKLTVINGSRASKPLYHYDPLVEINISQHLVDIFKNDSSPMNLQEAIIKFKEIYGNKKPRRSQLKKENNRIYDHFRKNKLLDKYCLGANPINLKQSIIKFKEIYSNRKTERGKLLKENSLIYQHFRKNKLLDKYCKDSKTKKLDIDKVIDDFKKIYRNKKPGRMQLQKENNRIYHHFRKNKLLDKYCLRSRNLNLKESIIKFKQIYGNNKPLKYQLEKENVAIYGHFLRHKLLDKYCLASKNKPSIKEYNPINEIFKGFKEKSDYEGQN